ncbi:MAG: pyrimidine dimer DNA glycosylase/endonuclease V [Candidatus Bathyarchaeota archaeon]|nr:pyrimidine dimer DNA glycosylase/endonuclease V [Candidatus Bathyarchaeota archaeon]
MVRIWCVPVSELDRQHLLGEHAELHCIVGALEGKHQAYRNHPQTLRFKYRIEQLYARHAEQVAELQRRGYRHNSPLPSTNQTYECSPEEYQRDHAILKRRQLPQQKQTFV